MEIMYVICVYRSFGRMCFVIIVRNEMKGGQVLVEV